MTLPNDAAKVLKEYLVSKPVSSRYHGYLNGYPDETWYRHNSDYARDNRWALNKAKANICPAVVSGFTSGLTFKSPEGFASLQDRLRYEGEQRRADREAWSTGNGFVYVYRDAQGKPQASSQNAECIVPIMSEDMPELRFVGKVWKDGGQLEKAHWFIEVYYETSFTRWRSLEKSLAVPTKNEKWAADRITWDGGSWEGEESSNPLQADLGAPHGFDEIPFAWYRLDAESQYSLGSSVLKDVLNLQDVHNKNLADWLVANDKAARMLILALGLDDEDDPYALLMGGDGKAEDETLKLTKDDTLLSMKAKSAQQLQAPTTQAFQTLRDALYGDVAAVTGLPEWYLRGKAPENSSYSNTAYLSSRVFSRQRSYVEDNKLEDAKLLRLLGVEGLPEYAVESFEIGALASAPPASE